MEKKTNETHNEDPIQNEITHVEIPADSELIKPSEFERGVGVIDEESVDTCSEFCSVGNVFRIVFLFTFFCSLGVFVARAVAGSGTDSDLYWFPIISSVIYILYWIDIFCLNPTFKFLKTVTFVNNIYDHVEGIRQHGVPSVRWNMECYHYETRFRTVTYRDSNGNTQTRTETYQEKVVTWRGAEYFFYRFWRDLSTFNVNLQEYEITRVRFYKNFVFADDNTRNSFNAQKFRFIENNRRRDMHYSFFENFDILGYIGRAISKVSDEVPFCLNTGGYLLICVFMGEIFYSFWLTRISPKKCITYTKEFRC